jgi:DNA-binding MarR family transcriptional regulator
MTVLDTYCRMWSTWQSTIPKPVADEDPHVLTGILRVADIEGGVSQSELQRALGLNQSRLSKLTDKLLEQQWVQIVPKPGGDRRMRFVRTTSKARRAMRSVESALASTLNIRTTAKTKNQRERVVIPRGQMSLLSRT